MKILAFFAIGLVLMGCGGASGRVLPAPVNPLYVGTWSKRVGIKLFTISINQNGAASVSLDRLSGIAYVDNGGNVTGDANGTVGPLVGDKLNANLTFYGTSVVGLLSKQVGN